jgi:uncharacterized glyoxalase superfamily protein PhnB
MVRDGRAALEFYQKAFGAQVLYQAPMPGMPGIFAQFKIGESYLQLTDMPGFDPKGPRSPETLGGTSVVLEMYVDDVEKSFAQAVQRGGAPLLPPTDMFFGDRYCWVGRSVGTRLGASNGKGNAQRWRGATPRRRIHVGDDKEKIGALAPRPERATVRSPFRHG